MTRQEVPEQPKASNFWKPKDVGEVKEGKYVRMDAPKEGKEKFGASYIIKEPGGHELSLPNHSVLSAKMKTLKPGSYVWITYMGKEGKTEKYKVEFDPDFKPQATLDVGASQADYMGKIKTELAFATKVYPDGIPDSLVQATMAATFRSFNMEADCRAVLARMKDAGDIYEAKPGFWKVV